MRGKYIVVKSKPIAALDDAIAEIDSLRDELAEWQVNLESSNMDHLPKYEEVQQAAETLDSVYGDLEGARHELSESLDGAPFRRHKIGVRCRHCSWTGKGRVPKPHPGKPPIVTDQQLNEISWKEFRGYGKREFDISRGARLSNAQAAATEAIKALRAALTSESDLELLNEIESAVQEASDTEFPGMY